jgi:hypothetical protein
LPARGLAALPFIPRDASDGGRGGRAPDRERTALLAPRAIALIELGHLRDALRLLLEKIPVAWQTALEDQRRRGWPNGLGLEAQAAAMLRLAEDLATLLLKYRFALTTHFLCQP